jgi:3-hydroxy-9,10-secoandrosta-1,3,5(10)-triene-9,17-dione monooxygenase
MTYAADVANPAAPPADSLQDRVRRLVPQLRANARTVDDHGRLTDDNVSALASAGIYDMMRPRRFGGSETPLPEQIAALAELGRGCGSTAWVAQVGVFSAWLAAQFSDEAQAEVFETADVRLCGTFAPTATGKRVDGGFVVTGSWPFNTGCCHAQWDVLPARVAKEDGTVEVIASLIPMSDLDIELSWDVDGLSGTGSNTTVGHEVFVPDHRTMPFSYVWRNTMKSAANAGSPLFRAAAVPIVMAVSAAVPVGMARGAMELFLDRLPGRAITYTAHANQAETQLTHLQLAEAQTKIELAWHLVVRMAESAWEHAEAGRDMSLPERARIRSDAGYATRLAREAVEILNSASGASSIRRDVPFRQFFRDIEAVSLHAALNPNAGLEVYGRVLLGLDPATTLV